MSGPNLLFNQEFTYNKLQKTFRFKDARMAYGKGPRPRLIS